MLKLGDATITLDLFTLPTKWNSNVYNVDLISKTNSKVTRLYIKIKPTKLIRLYKWFYNRNCRLNEFKVTNVVSNSQVLHSRQVPVFSNFHSIWFWTSLRINRMTLKLSEVLKGEEEIIAYAV